MFHERLQTELIEAKKEIERLKECASTTTTQTVHKELSLISVVPKLSCSDDTVTLEGLQESIETSGSTGRWPEGDQRKVAVLKLKGSAKLFIIFVISYTSREQTSKHLSKLLDDGTGMSIWTSTILRNCRRLGRLGMKVRNNSPIVARV